MDRAFSTPLLTDELYAPILPKYLLLKYFSIAVLAIIVGGLLAYVIGSITGSVVLVGIVIALIVIVVLVLATIQGALSGIYQAALYRYAQLGVAPDNFDIEVIEGAFKPKRKRGLF